MRATTACTFLSLICGSAAAGEAQPISPEDFLSLVEGKTVHYTVNDEHYGSERFYGKGRATWQFPGATCEDGIYWPVNDEICFRYGTPSCWSVTEDEEDQKRIDDARRITSSSTANQRFSNFLTFP